MLIMTGMHELNGNTAAQVSQTVTLFPHIIKQEGQIRRLLYPGFMDVNYLHVYLCLEKLKFQISNRCYVMVDIMVDTDASIQRCQLDMKIHVLHTAIYHPPLCSKHGMFISHDQVCLYLLNQ